MNLYTIKDNEVGTYHKPFPNENDIVAQRATKDAMKEGFLKDYPTAFALYKIGRFDALTGMIEAHKPELILELSSLKPTETDANVQK